jgi:hypothetical protein
MIRKELTGRGVLPTGGELGIDRGVLDVLMPPPVFDERDVSLGIGPNLAKAKCSAKSNNVSLHKPCSWMRS